MSETENLWENAASDPSWNQQANFSLDQRQQDVTFEDESPDGDQEELVSKLVRYLVNSWHFSDFSIGLAMVVYATILGMDGNEPKAFVVTLFILGSLCVLRAVGGTYSVYKDKMGRIGMLLSAYMSTGMSVVLFIVSMVAIGMRKKIAPFLEAHQSDLHLPSGVVHFFEKNVHFTWAVLLVCCAIDVVRWISLVNYREYLLEEDELAIQIVPSPARSRNRRPWWWKRSCNAGGDDLGDPLLGPSWAASNNRSYQMDEGLDQSPSMWSSLFGKKRRGDGNPRDDGSVDFVSVQEDWASRSEEDPFWWSRDENAKS
jgi:hypothetical protein